MRAVESVVRFEGKGYLCQRTDRIWLVRPVRVVIQQPKSLAGRYILCRTGCTRYSLTPSETSSATSAPAHYSFFFTYYSILSFYDNEPIILKNPPYYSPLFYTNSENLNKNRSNYIPVESLSRVVSEVDGYTSESDNSSNEQSFILDSTVKLSLP